MVKHFIKNQRRRQLKSGYSRLEHNKKISIFISKCKYPLPLWFSCPTSQQVNKRAFTTRQGGDPPRVSPIAPAARTPTSRSSPSLPPLLITLVASPVTFSLRLLLSKVPSKIYSPCHGGGGGGLVVSSRKPARGFPG
jgi:hypothetical protein